MPNQKLPMVFALAMGVVLSLSLGHAAKLTAGVDWDIDNAFKVDQIVTGRRVSPEHLKRWHQARITFDACGLCGSKQSYPGDSTVTGSIEIDSGQTKTGD